MKMMIRIKWRLLKKILLFKTSENNSTLFFVYNSHYFYFNYKLNFSNMFIFIFKLYVKKISNYGYELINLNVSKFW